MQLTINGETRECSEQLTIDLLLEQLKLPCDQVVVELNNEILTPKQLTDRQLKSGDTIELIQFVGGG